MDVEQGRGHLQRLLPTHDSCIEECLEDIAGTFLVRDEQGFHVRWSIRFAPCLVVHNTERIILAIHTVDVTADARTEVTIGSMDGHLFAHSLFALYVLERGIAEVVLEELFDVANNHSRVDELGAVVFRLFILGQVEEQFLEGFVYVSFQTDGVL